MFKPTKDPKSLGIIILLVLIAADGAVWFELLSGRPAAQPAMHFLDIGQGDSEFVEFAGGVKIMTDAGPDAAVVDALARALPQGDHSIDIAIVSHPQLDHFNGFNYLLDHYRIGAFIINGRDDDLGVKQWPQLLQKIKARDISLITLGAGDSIRYEDNKVDILSPNPLFNASGELNDTGFVEKIRTPGFTALLTADTGTNIEGYLLEHYGPAALAADILKVGHHGSKYSSGLDFLRAVHPAIAAIEVSARNTYGHPAPATLQRLSEAHIPVFRTDQRGNITVRRVDGKLKALTEK